MWLDSVEVKICSALFQLCKYQLHFAVLVFFCLTKRTNFSTPIHKDIFILLHAIYFQLKTSRTAVSTQTRRAL